jgi:hypothetical protein
MNQRLIRDAKIRKIQKKVIRKDNLVTKMMKTRACKKKNYDVNLYFDNDLYKFSCICYININEEIINITII